MIKHAIVHKSFDDLLFIGFLLIALTPQEKRLGDWLAGTLVVKTEQDQTQKKLKVSDRAIELAERLWAEADLALLLPDDFAVIRQYLQRRTGLEPEAKRKLSLQLAKDIQRIIHLETLPDDLTYALTADLFLEAVYLAYQRSEEDTLS